MRPHSHSTIFGLASAVLALTLAGQSVAQEAPAQLPPPSSSNNLLGAPVEAFNPVDPAAPLSPVPGVRPAPMAAPAQGMTCGAGDLHGVPEADGQTAVWLICGELRQRALAVPPGAAVHYRVDVLTLGSSKIVSLTMESPPGQARDSRSLRMRTIEEVPVAAPRLVDALLNGTSVESTQKVDNLVASETRRYRKKSGEFKVGGGVIGTALAGSGGGIQPGFSLRADYETPSYGVGADLRYASGGDNYEGDGGSYAALSVGGRYFLMDGDVAPFVGTGLSWSGIDVRSTDLEPNRPYSGGGSGVGVYGEVGLEVLRLHSSRLALDLRAEAPLYQMTEESYPVYNQESGSYSEPQKTSHYVVPITFGLVYTFGGR